MTDRGDVVVRPFRPGDRARVRHICFVTGYMGEPVEWLWGDAESFATIFTGYYTDAEPESALVAEIDGEVMGYLLGCVDSARAWNPAGVVGGQVVRRALPVRPGTARFVWRSLGDVVADAARKRLPPAPFADERWPAHLHIDLLRPARGRGAGATLMRRWLDALRRLDVPGCHLETVAENSGAVAFFESMGFEKHGHPIPAPGLRSPAGTRHHLQVMVQSLQVGSAA
ncbi:MAG: GNAT family N-acetyltransferase [Acidimicrobiales bacterium]